VIAFDANLLVDAHMQQSPLHARAATLVGDLIASGAPWAIPAHCLAEFFSVATNPRIYKPASTPGGAYAQIEAWVGVPSATVLSEDAGTWRVLESMHRDKPFTGPAIHDARIAAVCLQHDVAELWTYDRDFSRFPRLRVRNPLVDPLPTRAGESRVRYRVERRGRPAATR
jgi:toxin-antitoxin system PIN domain toxin